MATAQAVKTGVTTQQSLALMKNMIRASVGEICYLRNLFPSSSFRDCAWRACRGRGVRGVRGEGREGGGMRASLHQVARVLTPTPPPPPAPLTLTMAMSSLLAHAMLRPTHRATAGSVTAATRAHARTHTVVNDGVVEAQGEPAPVAHAAGVV
jgi:hypothetical protein